MNTTPLPRRSPIQPFGKALALAVSLALALAVSLGTTAALAQGLVLAGSSKNPRGANRVGVFALDRAGAASTELVGSAMAGNSFSLSLADSQRPKDLLALGADTVQGWPGLPPGRVQVAGSAKVARLALVAYQDSDNSGGYSRGDALFETIASKAGQASALLVYSDGNAQVTGEMGFKLELQSGWNLFLIDVSSKISVNRVSSSNDLQLEVFKK
jgi:hypothetical protein